MAGLEGRVVVVTGGAQGIGLATASAFAAAGATVVVWDRSASALESARSALEGAGAEATLHSVDVVDVDAVRQAAEEARERHGKVDVLVNNAGVNVGNQSAATLTDAIWDTVIDVNLKGTVNAVRALGPSMVQRKWGRIINTGSILGRFPVPTFAAYAAAKSGVVALTQAWANEMGPHGVTVNAVAPGFIDTPMNAPLPPELIKGIVMRTPVRRLGTVADIARVHLFLADEAAGFINGATIAVDGGLTL